FIPQCFASDLFGSSVDGSILQWTSDHSDLGGVLERRFRAGIMINSGTTPINNVILRTNPGQTPFIVGTYADPTVELTTSKDGGFAWTAHRDRSLGAQGEYRAEVEWRSLGRFGYPGALLEFRVTDPVPFRVSKVLANEPYGGI